MKNGGLKWRLNKVRIVRGWIDIFSGYLNVYNIHVTYDIYK